MTCMHNVTLSQKGQEDGTTTSYLSCDPAMYSERRLSDDQKLFMLTERWIPPDPTTGDRKRIVDYDIQINLRTFFPACLGHMKIRSRKTEQSGCKINFFGWSPPVATKLTT